MIPQHVKILDEIRTVNNAAPSGMDDSVVIVMHPQAHYELIKAQVSIPSGMDFRITGQTPPLFGYAIKVDPDEPEDACFVQVRLTAEQFARLIQEREHGAEMRAYRPPAPPTVKGLVSKWGKDLKKRWAR